MANNNEALQEQITHLTTMVQGHNNFMNSAQGRKFRDMAEREIQQQRVLLVQKNKHYNELKQLHNNGTNLSTLKGTQFVKINGVPTVFETGTLCNEVIDIRPVTTETYKSLNNEEKIQFDKMFPSESMAIEYNSYQPNLNAEYFQNATIAKGADGKTVLMYWNRPTLTNEADWHNSENTDIRKVYGDDYENYRKGLTVEMKEYEKTQSEDYRRQVAMELIDLKEEISHLEREVGQSATYLSGQVANEGSVIIGGND